MKVRVRKTLQGAKFRFRYSHSGEGAAAKGDFTNKQLESLDTITFIYSNAVNDEDKKMIETKWKHKLVETE